MSGFGHKPKSGRDRLDAFKAQARAIPRRECEDPARRARLEKTPPQWLRHYFAAAFPHPFSSAHKDVIQNCLWSAEHGAGSAAAIPRGDGKTTLYFGLGLYLIATRLIRFPVLVGEKHSDAASAIEGWLAMLSSNDVFAADYPELCQPFQQSTHATAMKNLTWEDTGESCGAMVKTMHKVIILPDSIGAIAARSAQGDAKGLYAMMLDGSRLRPDFLLFDDAQDPDQAGNAKYVQKRFDKLKNVFMGMAGPSKRLTVAAACTVEQEGDVSCKLLEFPGWRTVRRPRITSWPGGSTGGDWECDIDDPQRAMWDEWDRIRRVDGQPACKRFFRRNRKSMSKGMTVLWRHRYDREQSVCALDDAMYDWYNLGADVFARAHQQQPIRHGITLYTLTTAVIESRATDRPAGIVPEWSQKVVGATDINPSYALTSVVVAFGPNQTGAVVWYGLYTKPPMPVPKEATEIEKRRIIYEALSIHGRQLAALPCRPDMWFIDGGGSPEGCVIQFSVNSPQICGLPSWCTFGRGWKNYRPTSRKSHKVEVGEQLHAVRERRDRRWLIYNADYWREVAQRGWTGEPGAPGSCSLPKGHHGEFALQASREQLQGKEEVGGRMVWVWNTEPGPHDYGDCMHMAYMGAAVMGIGTDGAQAPAPQPRSRWRRKHVRV